MSPRLLAAIAAAFLLPSPAAAQLSAGGADHDPDGRCGAGTHRFHARNMGEPEQREPELAGRRSGRADAPRGAGAAGLQGRLDRHEARRPRRAHRRAAQGQRPRQAHAADRPSRYGVRARPRLPALGAQGRSRNRAGFRRRQGRYGGDDRRAARDEGRGHARSKPTSGGADRRRGGCGRSRSRLREDR